MESRNQFDAFLSLLPLVYEQNMPLEDAMKVVTERHALTAEEAADLKAEWKLDTQRISNTDWEHSDDFVAQEFRALRAG